MSSGMPDLMDEGEDDEIKVTPKVPAPEEEALSEAREVARWADDPVPIGHSFLVC